MSTMTTTPPRAAPMSRQRRKKDSRTEIWSNLLKQTAQAQARSRTQAVQHRQLIICGGEPEDQRRFLTSLARPPPSSTQTASTRNHQEQRRQLKSSSLGDVRLSNRFAYGYGYFVLFSPPLVTGTGVLGGEVEEVARVEVHTLPEAERGYVGTLRGLLQRKEGAATGEEGGEEDGDGDGEVEQRRPGVCILLSWKKPWEFLEQMKRWIQLLAQALLQDGVAATDPMDVLKDANIALTIVVQHTETQEDLFRENYQEEDFDWISQCLRTAIMPLHPLSALLYTTSTAPPQQPGNALTEAQKVIFDSLALHLPTLSPKLPRPADATTTTTTTTKKEEVAPKSEFMDRMAIVIPKAWDSYAYIRILSETFSPEDLLRDWLVDLQPPTPSISPSTLSDQETPPEKLTQAGAEVYESTGPEPEEEEEEEDPHPSSLTTTTPSAIHTYERRIIDPQSHRRAHHVINTTIPEITTKPDQKFLSEMRAHLLELEASDMTRERPSGVSTTRLTSGSSRNATTSSSSSGLPQGSATGALGELGDVSFNVGGVSYDSVSAEIAIERLRRPAVVQGRDGGSTPTKGGAGRVRTGDVGGGAAGRDEVKSPELPPIDKLEEYFASLVAKSGGGGSSSREGTPGRGIGRGE